MLLGFHMAFLAACLASGSNTQVRIVTVPEGAEVWLIELQPFIPEPTPAGPSDIKVSPPPVAPTPAATPDAGTPETAAAGGTGQAAGSTRGWIGVFGGASAGNADGIEGGALFGASGAFFFTRNLGLEVGVESHSLDVVGTSGNGLSGGSLNSTIVTGSVLARFRSGARVAPYLVGGVVYYSNSFEIDPAISGGLSALNFRATEELESKLGFGVGGGVDVELASRFSLFGEIRYMAVAAGTRVKLEDTVSGTAAEDSGSQDLNGLAIRGGIRVVF